MSSIASLSSARWLAAVVFVFLALSLPGAGARGIVAEEVQPMLARYPVVLDQLDTHIVRMPPWELGSAPRPRWVSTPQWPVIAWDGESRMWPLFIRGHQMALGAWCSIALQPLLGGGVAGLQRASGVMSVLLLLLAFWCARSLGSHAPTLAAAFLALSFGTLFFSRTGYSFELLSRLGFAACVAFASARGELTPRRAVMLGVVVGVTLLSRATIGVTLFAALAALWLDSSRRPTTRSMVVVAGVGVALPMLVLVVVTHLVPFASGAGPLATFPWERLAGRMVKAPGHLVMQLAWLGDANSVLDPLRGGFVPGGVQLTSSALVGAVPFVIALVRWWKGIAGAGERMLVAGLLANSVVGAALYDSPLQFQLAIALDVLLALALLEQVSAIVMPRWRLAALSIVLALKTASVVHGLRGDDQIANPMFSGKTQQGVLAHLNAAGASGAEVVTTTYNQAGVLEAWSDGAVSPVHAWTVLRRSGGDGEWAVPQLERVLRSERPRFILLSVGPNPMDGPFTDNQAVANALPVVMHQLGGRIGTRWDFPTESGGPGWSLVELNWLNAAD